MLPLAGRSEISHTKDSTMLDKIREFEQLKERLMQGGGKEATERQHASGKLTARERVEVLLDPGSFRELDLLSTSAEDVFSSSQATQPADAVIVGCGKIDGRPIFIWSQDATVLGGSLGVVHARKISVAMAEALQARVPIVGIIDSVGERASDLIQYPHFYSLETICNLQVLASGVAPQIALVMGPCTGGLALSTALADFVFLVRKTSYMHIVPPPDNVSGEELGEAWMHAQKTGCCDVFAEDDGDCLKKCRQLLSYLPLNNKERPPFIDTGDTAKRREEEIIKLVPADLSKPYDMRRLISLIVDNGEFFEIKHYWATNLITCLARLGGQTVGIIANNPQSKGGCMSLDASDKMARFVRFCDAFNIPLIWLADCPGFLPAIDEETRGLIRHGSKVIFNNAMATVPQITVVTRKLYGGAGLAMPGKRLGGDFLLAWPTVNRGLMGPEGAVAILYENELGKIEDKAERERQRQKRIKEMEERLKLQQINSTQAVIDPRDTRPFLIDLLKLLGNKERKLPPRKHDNIRL